MRISSMQIFNIARQGMADVNQDLVKTQEQMSTGKRVLTAADDPVAATKILQITNELDSIEQYKKNIDIAQNSIAMEESVLSNVNSVIQRVQELAVAAGNTGTLTPNDYRSIASEVDERLDEMLSLLNSRNANGDYIFGGYKSGQAPFEGDSVKGFLYRGDEGQQRIKVSSDTTVAATDSGKTLFMDVKSANNTVQTYASPANRSNPPVQISIGKVVDQDQYDAFYPKDMIITFRTQTDGSQAFTATERGSGRVIDGFKDVPYAPGQEIQLQGVSLRLSGNPVDGDRLMVDSTQKQGVLDTIALFKEAMTGFDGSAEGKAKLSAVVASTLDNLGNAHSSTLDVIASLGGRMNTLASTRDLHLDTELFGKDVLSQLRDVDYAEAATRLSQQSMILQAAQQSFIRVSQLTLFSRM